MTEAEIEKALKRLAEKRQLSHGYIFFGQDLDRQKNFALSFLNYLESGEWKPREKIFSDARILDGGREDLGVGVARASTEFLYRFPAASEYRSLLIISASELTSQAQNAMLKIAEEPPRHGLIILVLRSPEGLLPALRSRFQSFFFPGKKSRQINKEEEQAREVAQKFLLSDVRGKAAIIKELNESEKEAEEKSEKVFEAFVSALITELSKDPKKNFMPIKQLLKRYSAMKDLKTSKKLQLEAVLKYF